MRPIPKHYALTAVAAAATGVQVDIAGAGSATNNPARHGASSGAHAGVASQGADRRTTGSADGGAAEHAFTRTRTATSQSDTSGHNRNDKNLIAHIFSPHQPILTGERLRKEPVPKKSWEPMAGLRNNRPFSLKSAEDRSIRLRACSNKFRRRPV
jgi:hypothetical protein